MPPLSIHLPSPLTSPLVLQPAGGAHTIRTVPIVVEEDDNEEFGGSEMLLKEEEEEEGVLAQEAEELDDQPEVLLQIKS